MKSSLPWSTQPMSATHRFKCPACLIVSPPSHEPTYRCGECGAYEGDTLPRPWSTQPITGAQHAAWMAEERREMSDSGLISRRDADLVAGLFQLDLDPNMTVREYINAYDARMARERLDSFVAPYRQAVVRLEVQPCADGRSAVRMTLKDGRVIEGML